MSLAEQLEHLFRGDIRFRGEAYLKLEQITISKVTADHVFGVVADDTEIQTQLSREESEIKMFCDCSKQESREATCKHVWATLLAVDEGDYLTSSPKPGYFPPFAVETPAFSFDEDEDWIDDFSTDVFQPSSSKRLLVSETEAKVNLRPWEARLHELRNRLEVSPPQISEKRERLIFYEIDIAESKKLGQLVVQTSQQLRRANGEWGKCKPLKLRPDKLEEIDREIDRQILAFVAGSTPERSNWHSQQSEANATAFRYRIPFELCELVLPLMCATERIRYFDSVNETDTPTLVWNEEKPWELALQMHFDKGESEWSLTGEFRRDDESLALKDVCFVIPGGFVFQETCISKLKDYDAYEWIPLLQQERSIIIPEEEAHELVDQLLDMPSLPRLDLPEELKLEEVECTPTAQLTIHSPGNKRWRLERLYASVQFDYLETVISANSAQWAIVQRGEGRCLIRDRKYEEQAWLQLLETGFKKINSPRRGNFDVEISARDFGKAVRQLIDLGWAVHAEGKRVKQPAEMQFKVKSGIDWFELHADVNFEGESVALPAILTALKRGDSTIRLGDGSLGIFPEKWASQFGLLGGLGVSEEEHVRFDNTQVALLDALLSSQESVDYDVKYLEMREKFLAFDGIDPVIEPKNFVGELRTYQREGLGWLEFLRDFRIGGCLADDMGLGKTIQILALLEEHYESEPDLPPSLIVVPKSLMFNWHQECNRFTPDLSVLDYTGLDRTELRARFNDYQVILTTYGTLRRDIVSLKEFPFEYAVLDEAQTIKNANSQVAKASRLLQAKYRVALSGTPIENHLGDLWSIFEYLNPGMLGRSSVFKNFAGNIEDAQSQQLLSKGLQPFILRRTKQEVASELPEKNEQTILCEMGEEQQNLYDELKEHYRSSILGLVETQGLNKSKMHVLEALLRLRQAACHPALLNKAEPEDPSAKLDVLVPDLEELIEEGHKALVFSQFTSMLSIVKTHLDNQKITYEYLDGQTRDRQACVENFQNNPDCGVFLISLKAGGLGLNLTAADYVFLLDPWWNPAVEAQAIDRAHRVGQTRPVFAYRLIVRGTVEEKIAELQQKKRSLADAILQADKNLLRELSTDDLELLLS